MKGFDIYRRDHTRHVVSGPRMRRGSLAVSVSANDILITPSMVSHEYNAGGSASASWIARRR